MEIIKFVLGDFWIFIGFLIILTTCLNFLANLWSNFLKYLNIRKHGYPPPYLEDEYFENKN